MEGEAEMDLWFYFNDKLDVTFPGCFPTLVPRSRRQHQSRGCVFARVTGWGQAAAEVTGGFRSRSPALLVKMQLPLRAGTSSCLMKPI